MEKYSFSSELWPSLLTDLRNIRVTKIFASVLFETEFNGQVTVHSCKKRPAALIRRGKKCRSLSDVAIFMIPTESPLRFGFKVLGIIETAAEFIMQSDRSSLFNYILQDTIDNLVLKTMFSLPFSIIFQKVMFFHQFYTVRFFSVCD